MEKIPLSSIIVSLSFVAILIACTHAYAHLEKGKTMEGGEEESLILSKYFTGDIALITDPKSQQWRQSFEKHVQSLWGHEISIRTINNGTYIFFLLSWHDPANEVGDGAAIIFQIPTVQESEEVSQETQPLEEKTNSNISNTESTIGRESNDTWYWSMGQAATKSASSPSIKTKTAIAPAEQRAIAASYNEGVITKGEWNNNGWNVLIGRAIQPKNGNGNSTAISFHTGVREESFVKFVVWDNSKGESFMQAMDKELPHSDFILLPDVTVYPKDVYVWSGILAAGAVLFFCRAKIVQTTNNP
jgi:hypothetical protein